MTDGHLYVAANLLSALVPGVLAGLVPPLALWVTFDGDVDGRDPPRPVRYRLCYLLTAVLYGSIRAQIQVLAGLSAEKCIEAARRWAVIDDWASEQKWSCVVSAQAEDRLPPPPIPLLLLEGLATREALPAAQEADYPRKGE